MKPKRHVISGYFCVFSSFQLYCLYLLGWGSSVLETGCSCVLGLLHQIPRLKWDCLPLGSFVFLEGLKVFKKKQKNKSD